MGLGEDKDGAGEAGDESLEDGNGTGEGRDVTGDDWDRTREDGDEYGGRLGRDWGRL